MTDRRGSHLFPSDDEPSNHHKNLQHAFSHPLQKLLGIQARRLAFSTFILNSDEVIQCVMFSAKSMALLGRRALRKTMTTTALLPRMHSRCISGAASWDSMTDHTRQLASDICNEDKLPVHRRVALSRAITLMESKNPQKKQQADYLLTYLLSQRPENQPTTLRVGFAGPPGAGKSSLLEAFGTYLLEEDPDLQLAVVCIDPASGISGGSILGDKTRMTELSRLDRAYVRPSSNAGVLGGLAAYTDDVVTTLGAAGYPLVLVETVGLGQAEVEVFQSVDILVLILPPGGGHELQGVKKGIVELANILAVSKADGDLLATAKATAADYQGAIRVLQQSNSSQTETEKSWKPPILLTSSVTKDGLGELWKAIQDYKEHLETTGKLESRRKKQSKYWMWKQFTRMMQQRMQEDPVLARKANRLESELLQGNLTPRVAAQELLDGVFQLVQQR